MRKLVYITFAVMALLTACAAPAVSETNPTEYIHTPYVSAITRSECVICGDGQNSLIQPHWGEDNVGILDLNTFEILRLEINRYEGGELIETPAGFIQTDGMNGGGVFATTDSDRGCAWIRIQGKRQAVDAASIQDHLCQICLDQINSTYSGDCPPEGYGIISFSDKTIRPLVRHTTFFTAANYGVDCEFEDNGAIDLLVFYCPPRFQSSERTGS